MAIALALAIVTAFACGMLAWQVLDSMARERRARESLPSHDEGEASSKSGTRSGGSSFEDFAISRMRRLTQASRLRKGRRVASRLAGKRSERSFEEMRRLSGCRDAIDFEGYAELRARLAVMGGALGACAGALLSVQLMVALMLVGAVAGFLAPAAVLRARMRKRADSAERHLPEMLDVIALGMRSGMSFDTSLALYGRHFDTMLSRELMNSQRQWLSGLTMRDEALRSVASSYDSVILSRTFETVIRSIRYGTSMVESLESDAAEARSAYKATKEEKVAKAPVKMMVPTGVLILPAMLILVMGPVLLELMEGGI